MVPCQGDADCVAVDGDTCTVGYCSDDGFCRHETSENCCGNGICEAGEAGGCSDDCEKYFEVDSCNYYGDETVRVHECPCFRCNIFSLTEHCPKHVPA